MYVIGACLYNILKFVIIGAITPNNNKLIKNGIIPKIFNTKIKNKKKIKKRCKKCIKKRCKTASKKKTNKKKKKFFYIIKIN